MIIKTIYECGKCKKEYNIQSDCEKCELTHNLAENSLSTTVIRYVPSKLYNLRGKLVKPTIRILVDNMNDRYIVKSSRMYKIKKGEELELNRIVETNSLQLMQLFMSKDKNFNQLAKQEIIKLMGI